MKTFLLWSTNIRIDMFPLTLNLMRVGALRARDRKIKTQVSGRVGKWEIRGDGEMRKR